MSVRHRNSGSGWFLNQLFSEEKEPRARAFKQLTFLAATIASLMLPLWTVASCRKDARTLPIFKMHASFLQLRSPAPLERRLPCLAAPEQSAAAIALKIFDDIDPRSVPAKKSTPIYLSDSRALRRLAHKEKNLSSESILTYWQPNLWPTYKGYVVAGSVLVVAESFLITGLLWQRKRRRKTEASLARTNERLRLMVEASRSAGWEWDLKDGKNQYFGDLRSVFGISSDTYSENVADFQRRIYQADLGIVTAALAEARRKLEPYTFEFRIVRTDQTIRWIRARGRYYNGDHSLRMLGIATDITDLRAGEEALEQLSGRLIEAQEEERLRIAREIHDDYNQRLALLSIDLEGLARSLSPLSQDAVSVVQQLRDNIDELAADLHGLSHSLHSSTLENLGLVAGIRTFCDEFADQQKMRIQFTHENVPDETSPDTSLCIFRIVQESLRNVKRHSGADQAEVRLESVNDAFHVSVFDHGRGFDPETRSSKCGIGLRSMEERLRLLGGSVRICSHEGEGTRLEAWLPLTPARQR